MNWYISTIGSDISGNGSELNPFSSINKVLTLCDIGDVINLASGTYNITSTTVINKSITITSTSKIDTILDANCIIFDIQSEVNINNLTLMSSNIIASSISSGFVLSNCILKYTITALELKGTFTITNNTFSRLLDSNVVDVIKIYGTRNSDISTNSLTDSNSIRYFIYLTNNNTYDDKWNSKGGYLTINYNTITLTNDSQSTTIIYQDYFNQYINAIDEDYNINTKLYLTITNNTCILTTKCKFINLLIDNENNLSMYGNANINSNNINNTEYGILHLDKKLDNSIITVSSNELTRPVFKIYSNVLDTKIVNTWNFRYLKLTRTTVFAIDIISMEAWYNKQRFYATTTSLNVPDSPNYPSSSANDDSYTSFAHTNTSADAYVLFDFGSNIGANRVRIVFRNNLMEKDINVVLTATNSDNEIVFQLNHVDYCKEMYIVWPSTSINLSGQVSNWAKFLSPGQV